MLYMPNTRIADSVERALVVGSVIDAEGAALVSVLTAGVQGVKLSTGSANEKFAGLSLAAAINPGSYAFVEDFVVGAGATYTLANTPVANTMLVFNVTGNAALTQVGTTPAAGEVKVASTLLTFNAAQVGASVRVSYRYVPTVQQVRLIQGDEPAGRAATFTMGSVGVITRGDVMTSQFDTSVNWNVANPVIALGADGIFTIGGSGTALSTAYVTSVPTPDSPYLGFHFSV